MEYEIVGNIFVKDNVGNTKGSTDKSKAGQVSAGEEHEGQDESSSVSQNDEIAAAKEFVHEKSKEELKRQTNEANREVKETEEKYSSLSNNGGKNIYDRGLKATLWEFFETLKNNGST